MSNAESISILPYTSIIGQKHLKLALELAYITPLIGGVLLSGERGTCKSTVVRAFARMGYGSLPVTIPINATEDRVVAVAAGNAHRDGRGKRAVDEDLTRAAGAPGRSAPAWSCER